MHSLACARQAAGWGAPGRPHPCRGHAPALSHAGAAQELRLQDALAGEDGAHPFVQFDTHAHPRDRDAGKARARSLVHRFEHAGQDVRLLGGAGLANGPALAPGRKTDVLVLLLVHVGQRQLRRPSKGRCVGSSREGSRRWPCVGWSHGSAFRQQLTPVVQRCPWLSARHQARRAHHPRSPPFLRDEGRVHDPIVSRLPVTHGAPVPLTQVGSAAAPA